MNTATLITLEAWLDQPFKTDGQGEWLTNREFYNSLSRPKRKYIANRLKKGRSINLENLLNLEDEV